ncbi:hypothetical protein [Microbacterium foliorum]|uniref:hypothetical protein n=1 Tax=Microbacterium foliorum TaxID=104336 RepID=UPI0028D3F652|nr:hypothetical protein [Microbacterium foliorum]
MASVTLTSNRILVSTIPSRPRTLSDRTTPRTLSERSTRTLSDRSETKGAP